MTLMTSVATTIAVFKYKGNYLVSSGWFTAGNIISVVLFISMVVMLCYHLSLCCHGHTLVSFAMEARKRHRRRIARKFARDSSVLPINDVDDDDLDDDGIDRVEDGDSDKNEHVGKWQNIRQAFVAMDYEPFIFALLPLPRTPDSNISHAE